VATTPGGEAVHWKASRTADRAWANSNELGGFGCGANTLLSGVNHLPLGWEPSAMAQVASWLG
jgi:hypothetical protein